MIPILILLGLGSAAAAAFSKISLIVIYLSLAIGFTSLLMFLLFFGFIDLGDHASADAAGVHDSTVMHDGGANLDTASLFMVSPLTFLSSGALFGAYGLITLPIFDFLPTNIKDYTSILMSLILTAFSYLFVIRTLFRLLKSTSISKSKFFFEGKEGDIVEAISENGIGKVAIRIDNEVHYIYVRTEDGRPIPVGRRVRIKRIAGDYGYVEEI